MSTSHIQECEQAYGPQKPTVGQFLNLLKFLPNHVEVQAIAINGQTGAIFIETRHDDGEFVYKFEANSLNEYEPSALTPNKITKANEEPGFNNSALRLL